MTLENWIREADDQTRHERLARANEVSKLFPETEMGRLFSGGEQTYRAFVEAQLTYISGLYLSTILMALAALERHFAGAFYASGLEAAKRMSFENLSERGQETGLFSADHADDFEKFRVIRNSYAHFREPAHELSSIQRMIREDADFDTILRGDAWDALQIMARYFNEYPYPWLRDEPQVLEAEKEN
jgi:SAM-dependent MidA family methyltransferase